MKQQTPHKWLLGLTLHAFNEDEKSFSIRINEHNADVFVGQQITDKSKPILSLDRENAILCLLDVLKLGGLPANDQILKGGFLSGVIKRYTIGEWGYNFGIVSQGASLSTIISITATMTDEEVKAVQKMAKESHYELDDLFEASFDADIQHEIDRELETDTLKDAIFKAQNGTSKNPYSSDA